MKMAVANGQSSNYDNLPAGIVHPNELKSHHLRSLGAGCWPAHLQSICLEVLTMV